MAETVPVSVYFSVRALAHLQRLRLLGRFFSFSFRQSPPCHLAGLLGPPRPPCCLALANHHLTMINCLNPGTDMYLSLKVKNEKVSAMCEMLPHDVAFTHTHTHTPGSSRQQHSASAGQCHLILNNTHDSCHAPSFPGRCWIAWRPP